MALNDNKRERLDSLWCNPSEPHATCGVNELYKTAKGRWGDISLNNVRQYLSDKRAYTLHKVAMKNFPRRRVLVSGPRAILGSDLADMSSLASENDGTRFLLVCLDVYSRYLHVVPIKDKRGVTCAKALKIVLDKPETQGVRRLWTDKGREFLNKDVNALLKDNGISIYHTESAEIKVSLVERVIRTLKGRIYRYLTEHGTHRYIDVLPSIVKAYNNRPHRGLRQITPLEAHNHTPSETRQHLLAVHSDWYKKYSSHPHRSSPLTVGDVVRLTKEARVFSKGYMYQNTEELFTVSSIDTSQPITAYRVKDLDGEELEGILYREELVKTSLPSLYTIDVLRERTRKGKKEVLVHYRGYNSKHDKWIPSSEVKSSSHT